MKKTFKNNPAMQFLSDAEVEPVEIDSVELQEEDIPTIEFGDEVLMTDTGIPIRVPDGYKVNDLFVEKKTKRVNLLMRPSVYEKITDIAKKDGLSVNEFIHRLVEKEINQRG